MGEVPLGLTDEEKEALFLIFINHIKLKLKLKI